MFKVASAQYPITYHNTFSDWQRHIRNWVEDAVKNGANLLLFPEYGSMELVSMFDKTLQRDIHRQVRALNQLTQDFCQTFVDLCAAHDIIIVAPSIPVLHENEPVNRVFVCSPNGIAGYQDKLFMTRFENEEWNVKNGENILTVFETSLGSFGIQICYDVEFPIGSALLTQAGAELILSPSCTETIRGATRVHVGARARAMENQVYTVVSQTIGEALWSPAVDINYGYAAAYSTPDKGLPEEGIFSIGKPQEAGWLYFEPDFSLLKTVREDGQVLNFQDMKRLQNNFRDASTTVRKVRL